MTNPELVNMLVCPIDKGYPLTLHIFQTDNEEIKEGMLVCPKCSRWYAIKDKIPEMLPDNFRVEKEDTEFLEKWKNQLPANLHQKWELQYSDKTYTRKIFDFYQECAVKDIQLSAPLPDDHRQRLTYITTLMKSLENYWSNFLDLGSAQSPVATMYQQRFQTKPSDAYGLEITRAFCLLAEKIKTVQPVLGDWSFVPFKKKTFDLTLWTEGPEHALDPAHVFSQIQKITKKIAIISVPSWQYLVSGHLHTFTMESFKKLLLPFFDPLKIKFVSPCWNIALVVVK